jgi:hypothetical protein
MREVPVEWALLAFLLCCEGEVVVKFREYRQHLDAVARYAAHQAADRIFGNHFRSQALVRLVCDRPALFNDPRSQVEDRLVLSLFLRIGGRAA